MSDPLSDPTLSDNEVEELRTPAGNEGEGTPRDTVEDNSLDDEVDDLFGDDDEDAPA